MYTKQSSYHQVRKDSSLRVIKLNKYKPNTTHIYTHIYTHTHNNIPYTNKQTTTNKQTNQQTHTNKQTQTNKHKQTHITHAHTDTQESNINNEEDEDGVDNNKNTSNKGSREPPLYVYEAVIKSEKIPGNLCFQRTRNMGNYLPTTFSVFDHYSAECREHLSQCIRQNFNKVPTNNMTHEETQVH